MSNTVIYLTLTEEDKLYLKSLSKNRTIQARIVDRARILLFKSEGKTDKFISESLGVSVNTVRRCTSRYKTGSLDLALFEYERLGHPVDITDAARAWLISIACQRPCDLGYKPERWTLEGLYRYLQMHAAEAGYPRLATTTKPWIQKMFQTMDIDPFKSKHCLEKRSPDFVSKMHYVLLVYKQIEMQSIPDTVSLMTGIDLTTVEAIPLISDIHKSSDFIEFIRLLDAKYPEGDTIRLILDDHEEHKSRETRNFLDTLPVDRFKFMLNPSQTSWLNIIENFFNKMTKQMLGGIHVNSKEELTDRIYKYFEEINAEPVINPWEIKMVKIAEVAVEEETEKKINEEAVATEEAMEEDAEEAAILY